MPISADGSATSPFILGIETSCDETAVAIVRGTEAILANEISSQIELHRPYGGVVPELASRDHNLKLRPLVESALVKSGLALADLDAVAATSGPGLASSLLIGNTTAKALALSLGKPFYSVNHLEGHLLSPFAGAPDSVRSCVALIVSGGHTLLVHLRDVGDYTVLGSTRDDAAGEAFDKVAKMLELPYPGGPEIDRRAHEGNGDPAAYEFPRSMIDSGDFAFSFSGLKTAVFYLLPKLERPIEEALPDLCASFQEAVVDVLVAKTLAAARATGEKLITVSGGVSCNRRLRERFEEAAKRERLELRLCEPSLTTDNAAMIAYVAALKLQHGLPASPLNEDIDPNLALPAAGG